MIMYQVVYNGDVILETSDQEKALQKIRLLLDEGKNADLNWYFV